MGVPAISAPASRPVSGRLLPRTSRLNWHIVLEVEVQPDLAGGRHVGDVAGVRQRPGEPIGLGIAGISLHLKVRTHHHRPDRVVLA